MAARAGTAGVALTTLGLSFPSTASQAPRRIVAAAAKPKPPPAKKPATKPASMQAFASKTVPPKPSARAAQVEKPVQLLLKLAPSALSREDRAMLAEPLAQKAAQTPAKTAAQPAAIATQSAAQPPPPLAAERHAAPQPGPEAAPKVANVTTIVAPAAAPKPAPKPAPATAAQQTQAVADAPHPRIVHLPEGASITFGPLKDVRMPTMMARQLVLPAHPDDAKAAQGKMQVDCAIDASGVPQDCKLLSASHAGSATESILSWLTSGAIRYPPKDGNGQISGRRVLTVNFPGQ